MKACIRLFLLAILLAAAGISWAADDDDPYEVLGKALRVAIQERQAKSIFIVKPRRHISSLRVKVASALTARRARLDQGT